MFLHGGINGQEISVRYLEEKGWDVLPYYQGTNLKEADAIRFCDHKCFYEGWKLLRAEGVLNRSICELKESNVVDRKCGKRVLKKIKNAFPFFLTYVDDIVDNKKFFKTWLNHDERTFVYKEREEFYKRGLAAIICTNVVYKEEDGELYTTRKTIIEFFENHLEYKFGLYGRYWDGYRNWRGIVKEKSDVYGKYKFAFCLENSRVNGYITEKIFDCFQEGIVPIYGGAYNVKSYIPEECFIDF